MADTSLKLAWESKHAAVNISGSADLVAAVTAKKLRILAFAGVLTGTDATFKFQTGAATDISGVFQHANIPAGGILTLSGQPIDTETVVIDAKTYTFLDALVNADGNVHISHVDASGSLDNLIAAIMLGAGSGTAYAALMTLHPSATAAAGAGDTMELTAKTKGVTGNSLASTETLTNGLFASDTLTGGIGSGRLFTLPYNPAGWGETVAGAKLNAVLTGISPMLDGMLTYAEVT